MRRLIVQNIGKIVSGDWEKGVVNGDTVLVEDGLITRIGSSDEIHASAGDTVIDADGMVLVPGFIDPHTHLSIGDYAPMQRMVGLLEESLLQGVTTILDEWVQFEGLPLFYPPDPIGVKATALLTQRAYRNFHPGGAMKIHAGSIMLVRGIKEADLKELADAGIWKVGQIGGSTDLRPEELVEMVQLARKYGMFIASNYGPGVLKHSAYVDLDLILKIKPDKLAHINGGTTAPDWKEVKELIDKTTMPLEIIPYGNLKMAVKVVQYLKEKKQLRRLLFGSDTPTGQGYLPVAVQRAVIMISSLCDIPAEQAIAMATGNTGELYGKWINVGKIELGKEADMVIIDKPPGSVGKDALGAIEAGDTFGVSAVMVDGRLVALRGRDTRPTERAIKLNGKELRVSDPNEALFDPPRFYWRSTGETYLL
jgi:enamidase